MQRFVRRPGRTLGTPLLGIPLLGIPLLGTLLLGAGTISLSGCIWPSAEPYLADQEPPPLELVSSAPTSGDEGVAPNGVLVFTFDQRVHPDAVSRETIWLTAGIQDVASARRVSLLDCSVTLRPHSPLTPLLSHRAQVQEVYGFAAGPLFEPHAVVFTTGDATVANPSPPPPSLSEVFAAVFVPRCASCHSGALPPAGLDLSTVESAAAGLISRESSLRPGSTLVVPGRHASSYLMWKLLSLPPIFGDPMPPAGDWPTDRGCANTDADLRLVADWIDGL